MPCDPTWHSKEGTTVLDNDQLDALAAVFATLGKLHREPPDDATLGLLRDMVDDWPLMGTDDAREGVRRWALSRDARESAEAIARDHNRLYGVSATAVVAPYESVHRDDDGLLFDSSTLRVREAYRAQRLQAPRLNREPDDHIGLEFDFVARLLLRALDAEADGARASAQEELDAARDFLGTHPLQWAPAMLSRAAAAAETHFMAGLALLSMGALESARTDLGVGP